MRRIYLIIALLLVIGAFFLGFHLGRPKVEGNMVVIDSLNKKIDSLSWRIEVSEAKAALLEASVAVQKKRYKSSDDRVKVLEKRQVTIARHYEQKIAQLMRYDSTDLDSAYIALYPDSVYKHRVSYNLATAKRNVKVLEWRVRESAADKVRLDSVSAISEGQEEIIDQQKVSILSRDVTIAVQDTLIREKDTIISLVKDREVQEIKKGWEYQKLARKYKRQRNGFVSGAVVVIGSLTYLLFKP